MISDRLLLWVVAAVLIASSAFAAPMYPFKALSPLPLPEGNVNIRLGVSNARRDHLLFQQQDKDRTVVELPSFAATIAVGTNTELFFRYPFLYLDQDGQSGNYGSGDMEILRPLQHLRQ